MHVESPCPAQELHAVGRCLCDRWLCHSCGEGWAGLRSRPVTSILCLGCCVVKNSSYTKLHLSLLFIRAIDTMTSSNRGRSMLIGPIGPNQQSVIKGSQGRSSSKSRGSLSLLSCITFPGVAPSTVIWAFPHQLSMKKMPPQTSPQANLMEATDLPSGQSDEGNTLGSFSPADTNLCQVDKKKQNDITPTPTKKKNPN